MDDRPLLSEIELRDRRDAERRRKCAQRCSAVESALRDTGFSPDTSYWSVALLVARICDDWQPLVRSLDRLASDRAIETSSTVPASRKRIVKRALAELESYGILEVERREGAKRRGTRPEVELTITLNRAAIMGEIEFPEAPRDTDKLPDKVADKVPDRFADKLPDRSRTNSRTVPKLSLYDPLSTQEPFSPSPFEAETTAAAEDWNDLEPELREAGVERVRSLLAEASGCGLTPSELSDAAYVVRHTPELTGGALFDHVRSGGWPVAGVRSAAAIRRDREHRSEAIREKVRDDAEARNPVPPQWLIEAATARRLIESQLGDCATPDETAAMQRFEQSRRNG